MNFFIIVHLGLPQCVDILTSDLFCARINEALRATVQSTMSVLLHRHTQMSLQPKQCNGYVKEETDRWLVDHPVGPLLTVQHHTVGLLPLLSSPVEHTSLQCGIEWCWTKCVEDDQFEP